MKISKSPADGNFICLCGSSLIIPKEKLNSSNMKKSNSIRNFINKFGFKNSSSTNDTTVLYNQKCVC
jgi:hypothetical protein